MASRDKTRQLAIYSRWCFVVNRSQLVDFRLSHEYIIKGWMNDKRVELRHKGRKD